MISFSQDQEEENALFDDTTRCRAAYSLLFHHNRLVRGHASELLLRRIGEIRLHGDSLMPETQYVFEVPPDHTDDPFSADAMERGVKVFSDSRMDIAVRWTALRQIYLHVKRPMAQESFVRMKGPAGLFAMLEVIASGTEKDWSVENMLLLLDCALAVVFHNDSKLYSLNQQCQWYFLSLIGFCIFYAIGFGFTVLFYSPVTTVVRSFFFKLIFSTDFSKPNFTFDSFLLYDDFMTSF